MRTIILSILTTLFILFNFQDSNAQIKEGTISIGVMLADDENIIPLVAKKQLETKLVQALSINGIGDLDYVERFVLTAKVTTISKDILPTTPVRVSCKFDVCFIVGDIIENKIYDTYNFQVAGIGDSETKAYLKAFERIKGNNNGIQNMLLNAKIKILDYYANNCNNIIVKAKALANLQHYDEAISLLVSVPDICDECYSSCLNEAGIIYKQKVEIESYNHLECAKNEWMKNPNKKGAINAAFHISQINVNSSAYSKVKLLQEEISQKLKDDESREWEFKIKQYEAECALQMKKREDKNALWLSIIDACKSIGTAWFTNRSQGFTSSIIQKW